MVPSSGRRWWQLPWCDPMYLFGKILCLFSIIFLPHFDLIIPICHLFFFKKGLQAIRCPAGLAFDIEKQTCDWKEQVKNCLKKEKERKVKPILTTDEPLCQVSPFLCPFVVLNGSYSLKEILVVGGNVGLPRWYLYRAQSFLQWRTWLYRWIWWKLLR